MLKIRQAFWEDKISRFGFFIISFFWVITVFSIFFSWSKLPPQIPLFYSRPWGEDQLVNPYLLPILPGGIIIMVLFSLIAIRFFPEEKFLSRILIFTTALCSILNFLNLLKIFFLIIY